jgi:nucleosome assembly protein 1-like 1
LYSHVIGDTVHWRPGKNLIELVERIKGYQESDEDHDDNSKDDDDGGKESFFKFFYPPPLITVPEGNLSSNQMHQDQGENREDEDREDMIDEEFDIGEALKERVSEIHVAPRSVLELTGSRTATKIVPHAVDYFTGGAFCYEDDDNYETDNEENSDEGEEGGDEDEEDD